MIDPEAKPDAGDYVDGRLHPAARQRFEAQLAEDPDLRAAVALALEVRTALREEVPDPSPGFYTCLRARFEAGGANTRRGWRVRVLSWEALGIAAAAVLLAALFLPSGKQSSIPQPATDTTLPIPKVVERDLDSQALAKSDAGGPGSREPMEGAAGRSQEQHRNATENVEDDGSADEIQAPLAAQPDVATRGDLAVEEGSMPPVAPALPAGPEAMTRPAEVSFPSTSLPAGIVAPDELREVVDPAEWQTLLEGSAGAALAPLGPPAADARLVLVGSDIGNCSTLVVRPDRQGYLLERGTGAENAGGCALRLPQDGRLLSWRRLARGAIDE